MKRKIPELLSPAGGWEQLKAAVNNGADAVYMGGSLFNARINAENFTEETLKKAVVYAHDHDVKVYITFNTLVRDSELERAFRYAAFLYETGADAVILQDMGLARLLHKYLPDLPLHLSTQGTVYNTQALELVRQFGFKRVVPARELSIEEIQRLCAASPLEVEVFVHGALCMCYSGQCQMSRAFGGGGRSGNRGLCAQPCRLLYTDDKGRKGYFLSPKDLCALELIPALTEAGAASFKIEGRLKSPEYVAVTTSVYRKYLDLYAAGKAGTPEAWKALIDPEDMRRLRQIFNRGGFTAGYLEGNPGRALLSGESPKNQGVYFGRVKGTAGRVRSKSRDKVLLDVEPAAGAPDGQRIRLGDGIEIRAKAEKTVVSSSVVTFAEKQSGDILRIGDFDRGAETGDIVYKVTDRMLREEVLSAPEKKLPVRMRFEGRVGRSPVLKMEMRSTRGPVCVSGDFAVEKALKKATSPEKISSQLMKLGDTPFTAETKDVVTDIDEGIMIPVSVVNQMRRDAAAELLERRRAAAVRSRVPEEEISRIVEEEKLGDESLLHTANGTESRLTDVQDFMSREDTQGMIPYILDVSKGQLDSYIEEHFEEIAAKAESTGILIGNPGWIRQFQDAGVKVYGDYGLNAYNSQTVKAYREAGVEMLYLSHESRHAGERQTDDPRFGGQIPLMITEHPFETGYLTDRKGVKHRILKCNDKNIIL